MDIWLIDQWTGEPSNRAPLEHDALIWVTEKELSGLQLADPRLPQLLRRALDPTHAPWLPGLCLHQSTSRLVVMSGDGCDLPLSVRHSRGHELNGAHHQDATKAGTRRSGSGP